MSERNMSVEEALRLAEDRRGELIRGTLLPKASPLFGHAQAQQRLMLLLCEVYEPMRRTRSGGWWIGPEIDIRLGDELLRPDICGWRVETLPHPPRDRVITLRPDWVCEILSEGHERRDRVEKRESYWRAGVPHYWLANPDERIIEVLRHGPDGYIVVQAVGGGSAQRCEPFDEVALDPAIVFGDEPAPLTLHDSNR